MDTIIQQLTEHAEELARETGGKLTTEVFVRVVLVPGKEACPTFSAYIGPIGSELACAHAPSWEPALHEVLSRWRKQGSVSDPVAAEVLKMAARASELGFSLVANPHVTLEEATHEH